MKIKKIILENNGLDDKILQYYTNIQILTLLRQFLTETQYISFIRSNVENTTQSNLEEHLIHNISKHELLQMIQQFDTSVYNDLVNLMVNTIYEI